MIIYKDENFGFYEIFNENNGTLIRSDINGNDPEMRSFPELLDIGIMGHCDHDGLCAKAGIDCYQNGMQRKTPHMSVQDFEYIARQATGKTFQIALGGAGDPNKHPEFEEILKIADYYRVVPNLITSGVDITDDEIGLIEQYCGAVAVSWYSRLRGNKESNPLTVDTINKLVSRNCVTNVHFVISTETIDEAIDRLKKDLFPKGINAVIFILYKPVGQGERTRVINPMDCRLQELLYAAQTKHPFRIGFDTCFTPAIIRFGKNISPISIDACEAATFSMYIDSSMNCFPCSFGIWNKGISDSLYDKTLREVWEGEAFSEFRRKQKEGCSQCDQLDLCRGGCKLDLGIDLCEK